MTKVRRVAKKHVRKGNQSGGFYFKGGEYFEYRPYFDRITIACSAFIKKETDRTTRRYHFIVMSNQNRYQKINCIKMSGSYSTIYSLQDMQKRVIHHPNIGTFLKSVNFE